MRLRGIEEEDRRMVSRSGLYRQIIRETVATFTVGVFAVGAALLSAGNPTIQAQNLTTNATINTSSAALTIVARVGSRGAMVVAIQRKVGATADGIYGPRTAAAVKVWQLRNHLAGTGIVDSTTYARMFPKPAPAPAFHAGAQTVGHSAQGRAITLTVVGSLSATKRVMVLGEIHGNERGGVPIANAIARAKAPAGVAYFVVSYPNPDGAALNRRTNGRQVDLNRNFPGWIRNGSPGSVYYSGTGPLSEPESTAMYAIINRIKPTAFVTYHQRMNVIDYGGGNKGAQATYARQTGMNFTQLSRYPGSQATWLHSAYPTATVMTVELPSSVPTSMVNRHIAALIYLAAHH